MHDVDNMQLLEQFPSLKLHYLVIRAVKLSLGFFNGTDTVTLVGDCLALVFTWASHPQVNFGAVIDKFGNVDDRVQRIHLLVRYGCSDGLLVVGPHHVVVVLKNVIYVDLLYHEHVLDALFKLYLFQHYLHVRGLLYVLCACLLCKNIVEVSYVVVAIYADRRRYFKGSLVLHVHGAVSFWTKVSSQVFKRVESRDLLIFHDWLRSIVDLDEIEVLLADQFLDIRGSRVRRKLAEELWVDKLNWYLLLLTFALFVLFLKGYYSIGQTF